MPQCDNGDLEQYIIQRFKSNPMTQYEIVDLFYKIVIGYQQSLFKNNIIHRDLKPQNILIHEGNPKIGDFGMTLYNEDITKQIEFSTIGTPKYSPPESNFYSSTYSTYKFDIYSLGCILYYCLYQDTPHQPKTKTDLKEFYINLEAQKEKAIPFPPRKKSNVDNDFEIIAQPIKDLICNMIVHDQEKRFTIDQVLSDKVFSRIEFLKNRIFTTAVLNSIQKLLDTQIQDYIKDKDITFEKIYYYSSIQAKQEIIIQDIIDRYFQFIFNSNKFTLLVLNQFVQNFTSLESQKDADCIILQFIFYIDIFYNYLITFLDEKCESIPKNFEQLEISYQEFKKSNRMSQTKEIILEEYNKWLKLKDNLIKELQNNHEMFHSKDQISYQCYTSENYYNDLYVNSKQLQTEGDACENLIKDLMREYYQKYQEKFQQSSEKYLQGFLLILIFFDKKNEFNTNFMEFSFAKFYQSILDTDSVKNQIKMKIHLIQNKDYFKV